MTLFLLPAEEVREGDLLECGDQVMMRRVE